MLQIFTPVTEQRDQQRGGREDACAGHDADAGGAAALHEGPQVHARAAARLYRAQVRAELWLEETWSRDHNTHLWLVQLWRAQLRVPGRGGRQEGGAVWVHRVRGDCRGHTEPGGLQMIQGTSLTAPLLPQALMWTDGRYHLQAVQEMDRNWTLMKDGLPDTPTQADWLAATVPAGGVVGVDPWLVGAKAWTQVWDGVGTNNIIRLCSNSVQLADKLDTAGVRLVGVETNLVDVAWAQDPAHPHPPRPDNTVFPLELQWTGATWQQKVEFINHSAFVVETAIFWPQVSRVREMMEESDASMLVVSALDDVAWLFNLRGSDISFNPVFFSYAAVTATEAVLFLRSSQVSGQVRAALGNGDDLEGESVVIREYDAVKQYIQDRAVNESSRSFIKPREGPYSFSK